MRAPISTSSCPRRWRRGGCSRCASRRWRSPIALDGGCCSRRPSSTCWRCSAAGAGSAPMASCAAMGVAAAALAVALTAALFRTIGPRRTRLIAQIVAAVIGAAFVIGLQVAAILSYGTLSRIAVLQSATGAGARARRRQHRVVAGARDPRRCRGARRGRPRQRGARSPRPSSIFAPRFGDHALAAAGVSAHRHASARAAGAFRRASPRAARCGARNGRCCCAIRG